MYQGDKEEIRSIVRDRYGEIARTVDVNPERNTMDSCCMISENVAKEGCQSFCGCQIEFTADTISEIIGYTKEEMEDIPAGANMGFGCGNPVALASIKPGETVIDLGSGGGIDCFLAAKKVGDSGRVIGVVMTPDMICRARRNKKKSGVKNVEFRLGEIERLPVENNTTYLIISNCVVNLSPQKRQVYDDAFRVLKPGGRLAVSDILALKSIPDDIQKNLTLVSACVGGAATIDDTKKTLEQAGFEEISITRGNCNQDFVDELLPESRLGEYVTSAYIYARKPL